MPLSQVVDLNTDIADRAAAAVAKQKEFDELMKEVKAAREEEALHEETAASLGELQARHQAAKNQIEVMTPSRKRPQHSTACALPPASSARLLCC